MVVSKLNNSIYSQFFVNEINSLDNKICILMAKISETNKELAVVDRKINQTRLNEPENLSFIGRILKVIRNFFLESSEDLSRRKKVLELRNDLNHGCLNHYEDELKIVVKAFEKYRQHSETDYKSKLSEEEIKQALLFEYRPGIQLRQVRPIVPNSSIDEGNRRAEEIFKKAMNCRAIKDLYIEAMLTPHPISGITGPWTLLIGEEPFIPHETAEFGGTCSDAPRAIFMDSKRSDDEILSTFVFELTNAVSSPRFFETTLLAHKGKIDRNSYAKEFERIEHEGALLHHRIMSKAVKEMGWNPTLDTYHGIEPDFEKVWPQIKDEPHAEFYRQAYDDIAARRKFR